MSHKNPIIYIFSIVVFWAVFVAPATAFASVPGVGKSFVSSIGVNTAIISGSVGSDYTVDTVRWFEWGTSPDIPLSNTTTKTKNGMRWEGFDETIGNLSPDTIYFFRVAAQNSSGTAYGKVISFKTVKVNTASSVNESSVSAPYVSPAPTSSSNSNTNINTNNVYVPQLIVTNRATDIFNTGARLNAVALPGSATVVSGWFEWGGTPNLGNTSVRRFLGGGASLPFSEILSGLAPDTTYFFKPVIQSISGTSEGVLFSFHTTGASPAVVSGSNSSKRTSSSVIAATATATAKSASSAVAVLPGSKVLKIEVIPSTDTVAAGERVNETVQLENITDVALKDAVVRVIIPDEAEYVSTGGDAFVQNGKMLTYKIGGMKPREKIRLLFWMKVGDDVVDKTPIETIAIATWEDKTHPNDAQSIGRATITADKNKTAKENLAAVSATKITSSFFPLTLKSWSVIVGFLFLLFAAYLVFFIARRKKEEKLSEEYGLSGSTDEIIIPIAPIKKAITEKGAPPENLPV